MKPKYIFIQLRLWLAMYKALIAYYICDSWSCAVVNLFNACDHSLKFSKETIFSHLSFLSDQ